MKRLDSNEIDAPVFTRFDMRIGSRHLSFRINEARQIYEALSSIFEPAEAATVVDLFKVDSKEKSQ